MYGDYGASTIDGQSEHAVRDDLAVIDISNIPDREGQFLRNALIDRFYKDGRPRNAAYKLHVKNIQETTTDLDITKTSDATRGQLKLTTSMVLIDKNTGETVLKRKLVSIGSYNILGSEFANRVTEENTRQNALHDLARQIEQQIVLYLRRN